MTASSLNKFLFLFFVPVLLLGFWLRTNDLQNYPPAISNDEAINAVDALHIAQTGNFPMYEEDEGRAEPLFRIIEALGILAFGRTIWALRIVSVLLSLLVIALVIWITRECLYDYPRYLRLLAGLFAGVTLATLAGHVTLSRTLFRGVLQLLTMGLSIGFVLRGIRRNDWVDYIISGIFGGITLYTYTAAWFFPPAFIVLFIALTLLNFRQWRQWLPKKTILGLVAMMITLPIIYLLLTYPRAVLGRAEALSPNGMNLAKSIQAMINQFLVAGDENPQYNVALAPLVPQLITWVFYLGLATLIIRLRRVHSWFIASLLLLLTLPALLSNEITHGLRISGEYVIVPVIIGLGSGLALWVLHSISNRVIVAGVGIIGLTSFGLLNSQITWERYTAYYTNPAQWRLWRVHEMELNHNEWFFRVDREDFGDWVSQQATPLLIPIEELNRQTTRSWLINRYPSVTSADNSIEIPENTQMVTPWSLERGDIMRETRQFALLNNGMITILPIITQSSHEALLTNIEQAERITRNGQIDFLGFVRNVDTSQIRFETNNSINAIFGNGDIRLSAWSSEETINTGQPIEVLLTWEAMRQIGHEYIASVQLQTQDYTRVASEDAYLLRWLYPTTIWDENLPVTSSHTLQLPIDLPSGAYQVTVGLSYASYPLILAESETQVIVENRVTVGWLKVSQSEPIIPESAYEVNELIIDDLFQLTHIEFAESADGQLLGQLHWQSMTHRPDIDATIFVHILDSNNQIVAQSDSRPLGGQYPTFIWDAEEIIRTDHMFNFDDFENIEDYTIRIGMYIFPGPQNLQASYQDQLFADGLVTIGTLSDYFSD